MKDTQQEEKQPGIPAEILKKISEKVIEYSKENTPKQVTMPAYHDGAMFGYSLAQQETESLKAWKESAISVMPDMQAIGRELNVPLGQSIHDKILPEIKRLKGLIKEGFIVLQKEWKKPLECYVGLNSPEGANPDFTLPGGCKILLRPLSNMTEEEIYQVAKLGYPNYKEINDLRKELGSERGYIFRNENGMRCYVSLYTFNPEQFHYLLSKHFDLFGLIESGLAIDATKLNAGKTNT